MAKAKRQFRFDTPAAAIAALVELLTPVGHEVISWQATPGRVLGASVTSDRESPPCDTSAMDGFAVRLAEIGETAVPVGGQARIGHPPPAMPVGMALKIVTGAPVPSEADAVIPREMTIEEADRFTLTVSPSSIKPGQNIRRRGENLSAGADVVPGGTRITPTVVSALATFGVSRVSVHRKVKVGILVTGDELQPVDGSPQPWQIRDSNGPVLKALVGLCPCLELVTSSHVSDDEKTIEQAYRGALDQCDAVLLSGGVSMGDYDHVPGIVERAGCRTIFHGVPIRPGQPLLGAAGPRGQLVMGLPGNPVSVMTCACRFARPALARLAGLREVAAPLPVALDDADEKRIGLWWYRPVTLGANGKARLVASRGSGDMVSAARSDGFVEIPPQGAGAGPWPLYRWELEP